MNIGQKYDTRTIALQANTPASLGAGSGFLLLDCGVKDSITIALGDSNAAFSTWRNGVRISLPEMTTARIQSSVAQIVTVAICNEGVELPDSRIPPVEPAVTSYFNFFTANATPVLSLAANNLRGVRIQSVSYHAILTAVSSQIQGVIKGATSNKRAFPINLGSGAGGPAGLSTFINYENPVVFPNGEDVVLDVFIGAGTASLSVGITYSEL